MGRRTLFPQRPSAFGAEHPAGLGIRAATGAALLLGVKWPAGSPINAGFLDGLPAVQERVKAVAVKWTAPGMANLKLVFVNDVSQADIRISLS